MNGIQIYALCLFSLRTAAVCVTHGKVKVVQVDAAPHVIGELAAFLPILGRIFGWW